MTSSSFTKALLVGAALPACLLSRFCDPASAQTVPLPEVVVTAPSPILVPVTSNPFGGYPVGTLPVATVVYAPVTIVPRSEIASAQPRTLGDALFEKPGLSASTYAPGASRPIIRGLDSNRVLITENGVGIHDVSNLGEDHAVPINPLVEDRIEVIRGPATLRYGSQAIGGVVSVENNRIPRLVPPGGVRGQVLGGVSSVDRGRNAAVSVYAGSGNVAVHADGFKTATEDYQTPLGRQRNSASVSGGGAVGLSYVFDRGFVGLSYSHYESAYHIPGGEAADSFTHLDPKQDRLQMQGEYRFEGGPLEAFRFWLNGSNYKHNEIGLGDGGGDEVRATFKNREVEARFELQHAPVTLPFGTLTGAGGLQLGRARLGTAGEAGGLLSPTDSRSVAAYLFEQLAFDHGIKIQGAARIEAARSSGTATLFPSDLLPNGIEPPDEARRRAFAPKSVSFGVLKDLPSGFVASLTAQYVERAPAAPELYSHGSHDAPGTFEIGDPNLRLERARSLELGLRRAEGPLRLDLSAYYTRYTGFIYRRLTGVECGADFDSCGIEDELKQVVYSQQNARFYGADLSAQYDALNIDGNTIGFSGQYDFVHAKFDDGTYVPRIPPHRLGGGIYWRNDHGWFAKASLLHAFAHDETAPLETRTPGYNLLKAQLSYTRKLDKRVAGVRDVTFSLIGDNLLDAKIRNSTSFKKDEVLLPGRGMRLSMTARF